LRQSTTADHDNCVIEPALFPPESPTVLVRFALPSREHAGVDHPDRERDLCGDFHVFDVHHITNPRGALISFWGRKRFLCGRPAFAFSAFSRTFAASSLSVNILTNVCVFCIHTFLVSSTHVPLSTTHFLSVSLSLFSAFSSSCTKCLRSLTLVLHMRRSSSISKICFVGFLSGRLLWLEINPCNQIAR